MITLVLSLIVAFALELVSWSAGVSLISAGSLIAVIGFIDDHRHIPARWRLLAHGTAGSLALMSLGGMPPLHIGPVAFEGVIPLQIFGIIYLVWMTNLYNFMDGIDGIASVQAVSTCFGISLLYHWAGDSTLIVAPLLLALAALGFLIWNLPPAKIFMGDAGSGFIGITFGILAIQASWENPTYFWVWCILLGVFIVDATYTLARRLLGGAKVYQAHRCHAYQHAARRAGSHLPVTVAVAMINICWLLPLAAAVIFSGLDGVVGVLIAYAPLLLVAIKYRAGTPEALE